MFKSRQEGYTSLEDPENEGRELAPEIPISLLGRRRRSGELTVRILIFFLAISLSINGFSYYSWKKTPEVIIPPSNEEDQCVTKFAKLKREVPMAFAREGLENGVPEEEWNIWNPDLGTVALEFEYAKAMGLPEAELYPWDFKKGIYFLHGHHTMHCLYKVRDSLQQFRNGSLQTQHHLHVDHCLTQLRNDILCNADDTPRFTTGPDFKQRGSGTGQFRMCRDWHKLDIWAKQHTACYQTPRDPFFDGKKDYESFMHCYDGSKPWEGAEIWNLMDEEDKIDLSLYP